MEKKQNNKSTLPKNSFTSAETLHTMVQQIGE